MMRGVGILFPGQGSQTVGMGADLFEARPDLLGERADRALGFSLRRLCLEGPEEELTRTEHAQPALFALSYAMWDLVESETGLSPAGSAGHSLGEYTALAAAGVFDFDTALTLVALRGRAMSRAAALAESGMAAVLGADEDQVEEACRLRREQGGRLGVANLNAPGQVVVAGGNDDLAWLTENAGALGLRRVIPLNVAGAFHSDYMDPAREDLARVLEETELSGPRFPVWSNTTARPHTVTAMRALLSRQLVEPVRFAETLEDMSATGIDTFIHIGPGDVTAGLARRTLTGAEVHVVSDSSHVRGLAEAIVTMHPHPGGQDA